MSHLASEAVAKFVATIGSAEENMLVLGQRFRVKHILEMMNSVLDLVHVCNS